MITSVCRGRGGVRVVVALGIGVAMTLGGCVNRDPYVTSSGEVMSGEWRIARQLDRVTGAQLPSAGIIALASNTYEDYPKPSLMQLTCFDGKPLVRFAFGWKIGADVNTTLGYRFDDKPGRDNIDGVRFMQDERMVVIEETPAVVRFVNDLRGARVLYLRIRSITQGRTTAEYKLDGSEPAIQAAFADCPLPAPAPSANASQKRTS
ncbi:MAG: hypothetical protein JWQ82_394 [Tardiphaga sp.]|nr:hypothetical protein [Tardiphaga sp.]